MKIIYKKLRALYYTRITVSLVFLILFLGYTLNNEEWKFLWMVFVPLGIVVGVIGYLEKCPNCKKTLLLHKPQEKFAFGIRRKCPYCNLILKS